MAPPRRKLLFLLPFLVGALLCSAATEDVCGETSAVPDDTVLLQVSTSAHRKRKQQQGPRMTSLNLVGGTAEAIHLRQHADDPSNGAVSAVAPVDVSPVNTAPPMGETAPEDAPEDARPLLRMLLEDASRADAALDESAAVSSPDDTIAAGALPDESSANAAPADTSSADALPGGSLVDAAEIARYEQFTNRTLNGGENLDFDGDYAHEANNYLSDFSSSSSEAAPADGNPAKSTPDESSINMEIVQTLTPDEGFGDVLPDDSSINAAPVDQSSADAHPDRSSVDAAPVDESSIEGAPTSASSSNDAPQESSIDAAPTDASSAASSADSPRGESSIDTSTGHGRVSSTDAILPEYSAATVDAAEIARYEKFTNRTLNGGENLNFDGDYVHDANNYLSDFEAANTDANPAKSSSFEAAPTDANPVRFNPDELFWERRLRQF